VVGHDVEAVDADDHLGDRVRERKVERVAAEEVDAKAGGAEALLRLHCAAQHRLRDVDLDDGARIAEAGEEGEQRAPPDGTSTSTGSSKAPAAAVASRTNASRSWSGSVPPQIEKTSRRRAGVWITVL
jgi:hypothetical protein